MDARSRVPFCLYYIRAHGIRTDIDETSHIGATARLPPSGGHGHRNRTRLRIAEQDASAAVRGRGLQRLEQIRYALVERDGTISIIADRNAT
jgi:hypothetical protein